MKQKYSILFKAIYPHIPVKIITCYYIFTLNSAYNKVTFNKNRL